MRDRCKVAAWLKLLAWAIVLPVLVESTPLRAQPTLTNSVVCRMGASAGARRYRPGVWSLVEVTTINQTDEPAEARAVLRFSDEPTLQYARQVYVPANSSLRTTCPVLVPEFIGSKFSVDFVAEQVAPQLNTSVTRTQREALLMPQSRLLNHDPVSVGLISDLIVEQPPVEERDYFSVLDEDATPPDQAVYELALAAKRGRRLSRKVAELKPDELPPDPAGLQVLDTIILSSDRITFDPLGLAVVRDWVLDGGQLWIMLDQVEPDTVAALLGDVFKSTILDKVGLTEGQIRSVRPDLRYRRSEHLEFDKPVDLVRVIPDGVTVIDMVDEWPAAFWQPFGAGRVYFTAIGPEAWMRQTERTDPAPISEDDWTLFFPREPLRYFAAECLVPRNPAQLGEESLRPFLAEQIGYRIVERRTVSGILLGFCCCVGVASLWFVRSGRPERLLWAVPLAVLLTAGVFVAIAASTKTSVPPTAATIARLVLEPGATTGHMFGLSALYNREMSSQPMGATRGGIFFPDMTAMTGNTRRVTWTDEGSFEWDTLALPAGVRTAPFEGLITLEDAVDCRAHFGENGLEGFVGPLPIAGLEDAVLVVPHQPSMSVSIDDAGSFAANSDNVLAEGEFITGSFTTDDQRRRKVIYQSLAGLDRREDAQEIPMLYAWADALDTGFVFPQPNQLGSTLISIPMRIERAAPGAKVTVPAPFVPYEAINDPRGRRPTTYGNRMRQWLESRQPTYEWLRFQLPDSVLPLGLERAELTINLRAPSRTVEILAPIAPDLKLIERLSNPIGTYTVVLDQPELLELDESGGLGLVIHVTPDESVDSADAMQHAPWKIGSLQLEVTGTVQGERDG